MLKETVTYTDFNGDERTEDLWFNLSHMELMKMFDPKDGDPTEKLRAALNANDATQLFVFFADLVVNAYGEKTADGKRFVKSPEISEGFRQSAAFDALFMQLVNDEAGMLGFIKGIIPSQLQSQINFDQITREAKLSAIGE